MLLGIAANAESPGNDNVMVMATYDFGQFSLEFKNRVSPTSGCSLLIHAEDKSIDSLRKAQRVFPYCRSGQAIRKGKDGNPVPLSKIAIPLGPNDKPWGEGEFYLLENLQGVDASENNPQPIKVRGNKVSRIDRVTGVTDPVNYDANRLGPYPNPYRLAIGLGKHIKVPEVPERDQSIEH
ncbi:hypothetical protein NCC49_003225 [Naganishia albida]|nr:hypothetical protein NCC49_003225 [Naganishia albida]